MAEKKESKKDKTAHVPDNKIDVKEKVTKKEKKLSVPGTSEKRILRRLRKEKDDKKHEKKALHPDTSVDDPFKTIQFVLMTEKAIQMIESQNKLSFIVSRKASKNDIRDAAENIFNEKVRRVVTQNDQKNRKKAVVKFEKEGIAGEIAIRLGII